MPKADKKSLSTRGQTKGRAQASRTALKRGVVRGRYDFLCVFPDGGSLHVTSPGGVSLSAVELIAGLREWADKFERALRETTGARTGQDDKRGTGGLG